MSTGTGEREAARAKAHELLGGDVVECCRLGCVGDYCEHDWQHDETCDRLTAHLLSTDAELRRVEGERDEAQGDADVWMKSFDNLKADRDAWKVRAEHAEEKGRCTRANVSEEEVATLTRERDEARAKVSEWASSARRNAADADIAERERDEARASLAVIREQALREAVEIIRKRGADYGERTHGLLLGIADQVEALAAAARPDVAPAGEQGE